MHQKPENKESEHSERKHTPEEFIVDPTMSNFLLLDQISRRFGKSLDVQLEMVRLLHENQKSLNVISGQLKLSSEQLKLLLEQTKVLSTILKTDEDNLTIQKMLADEGKRLPIDNIVGSNKFLVIDIDNDPGHPVKGFFIKNNGPYPIFISDGENMVGPSIEDVKVPRSRFYKIDVDQEKERHINVPRITDIYIIQDPDIDTEETSNFTGELVW